MKAGPSTLMIAFDIGEELWSLGCGSSVDRSERGDSQGVPFLLLCSASGWQEDLLRSSSPILLEWDEETCGGLFSMMSHLSAGKG